MSEQQHNANVPKIHKRHIDLFPKRRQSDHRAPLNGGYLTTFTDLMALLLTFFILIYATRDPAPIRLIVIDPPAIAAPVKPTPQPTPFPSHAFAFNECLNYSCGNPPYRVVCAPDGWFVDVAPYFPAETYGWRVTSVQAPAINASSACN